ncbi:MAG: polysaccharide biosynthesis tyrosine autokinase [Bacteroidetes bacterium]|nr:polysaccharide biosynthesis tyrosine autokinase [Bacteroidota bacterium]
MPESLNENIKGNPEQELNKPMGAREFVFRYLKYLPLIIISVGIALILAFIRIRYSVKIYQVQSSMLIKSDQSNSAGKDEKLGELLLMQPPVNLNNEIEILKSKPLIQRVVSDLGFQKIYFNKGKVRSTQLYNEESPFEFDVLKLQDSTKAASVTITILNNDDFTLGEKPARFHFGLPFFVGNNQYVLFRRPQIALSGFSSLEFQGIWMPLPNAADMFISSLKIGQINESATILLLTLQTQNINIGKDVLNKIMSVYDSTIIEDKNRIALNTLNFINKTLDTLQGKLDNVEGSLSVFMKNNETFNIEEQSKVFIANVDESTGKIAEQDVKLTITNWLLNYITNTENIYKLVPTDLGIDEPSLLILIGQYNQIILQREAALQTTTEKNPTILAYNAALDKIRTNMQAALQNVKSAYLIAKNNLEQKTEEVRGRLKSLPAKSMQSLNIERKQKILEDLYSFLLQKKLETSISSASTISNSKPVEEAVGSKVPVSPDKGSLYSTYILLGLIIPISIIAVFELLSDKVNNRAEIERATNAPILGEIGHSEENRVLVVTNNSRRFIAEQFRIIRTNLQYVIGRIERPVILVTSSFSGEGKSFVSTNIGAAMALAGKKTVVMEFDIRKPKILTGLEIKRKMGITNYIIGKAKFEELPVAVSEIENLYVIPCGPIPPNPAELLLEPRLKELINRAKEEFEVVIMDTAPAGLVSDAMHLGEFANCTLYIVRRGHTIRRMLGLIQNLYTSKKLPSISLLLNDIKLEGGYYGGYYGGYGYYGYGYGQESGYFEKEVPKRSGIFRKMSRWYNRWFS